MSERFEQACRSVLDWMITYRNDVAQYPVLPSCHFGDTLAQLPTEAPNHQENFSDVMADFKNIILPAMTHWQSPNFYAYFPANSSDASVLAEMITATMGAQCMSWATSPAATELEIRMMEWLRKALGLSTQLTGSIQDSASSSTMTAMLVARERKTDFAVNEYGYRGPKLTAYCSAEAHSSVEKAAKIIGIGREHLRKIVVDEDQAMRIDILQETLARDIKHGFTPFFIVGAFGTTSTTAVDDLEAIAKIAQSHQMWFHVDAAYAGAALILPEFRMLAKGMDLADSIVINAHKWLLTTFDCSLFFTKHIHALKDTFQLLPEYLKRSEPDDVVNFRDWGPGLGRRFRALKLWFVLRWYGVQGIQDILRGHIALATLFESLVQLDHRFELVGQRRFNLVCFRVKGDDEVNQRLLHSLNQSGKMFLSHTKVNGALTLRIVIGQTDVTAKQVRQSWAFIQQCVVH